MSQYIDRSVYPDMEEPPAVLVTRYQKADYVHRICSAWDFDIFPEPETFELMRGWRDIFDEFPLNESPAYHTFRRLFRWPEAPIRQNATVRLTHEILDRAEGRSPDPFLRFV